jgi:hypothetical protein
VVVKSFNSSHSHLKDHSSDIQHSRLLKFFTLSSLFSMIIILLLVGMSIHILFTHFLIREAESEAVKIGLALLEQEKDILIDQDKDGRKYIKIDEDEIGPFDKRVKKSVDIFRIVKLKIYTPEGFIIYSTDVDIIGESDHTNKDLHAALKGEVSSKLESETDVWDLMDEQKVGSEMVETYLPIRDQGNNIVGVYEIYMDVSSYRNEVKYALIAIIAIFLFILILVFGVLRIFMKRAIKTIYSKSQDIRILRGLLPICSFCKKIKNDAGEWEILENYISIRTESQFSHGLCPECKEKHYPDL